MKPHIRTLTILNKPQVMPLFLDCFINDPIYQITDKAELEEYVAPSVEKALETNLCIGIFDDNKLIGACILFDSASLLENINTVFGAVPYMIPKILPVEGIYLMNVMVAENYRRMGIATYMLDYLINKHNHIVADVDNRNTLSMYKKRGFTIIELDKDYWIVRK